MGSTLGLDPQGTLPKHLQTAALLVRGSTAVGKYHLQVTASADPTGNSDALLYTMVPDIEQLDALLAMQDSEWTSFAFRGVSDRAVRFAAPGSQGKKGAGQARGPRATGARVVQARAAAAGRAATPCRSHTWALRRRRRAPSSRPQRSEPAEIQVTLARRQGAATLALLA